MGDNILDSVMNLEDIAYQEGLEEGRTDGVEIGTEEGMVFGLEQGYRKALEMGKLHGRATMLNACLSKATSSPGIETSSAAQPHDSEQEKDETLPAQPPTIKLPTIPENPRLRKHIDTLLKLTDPATVSLANSDEAVEAFDDRMKKAVAKAKVIDKLIAEPYNLSVSSSSAALNEDGSMLQHQATGGTAAIEELGNAAVRR